MLPLTRAAWQRFAIMAALNNAIPFALIAYGETAIASGLASILNAATPLFTVLIAHVLTDDEKLTPLRVLGIGLGFLGVVVLVGPDLLGGLAANLLAETACLLAAIAYAFAGVYGRRFGGMSAIDRGNRPACRGDTADAAAGDCRRSAVAAGLAARRDLGLAGRDRRAVHRGRLSGVFPPAGDCRGDQSAAGDVPAADHLAAAGRLAAGRGNHAGRACSAWR